jgi:hypothetical protein
VWGGTRHGGLLVLGVAMAMASCRNVGGPLVPATEGPQLVERYHRALAEGFRQGNVDLVDPVVLPQQGRRLAALIGAARSAGVVLDPEILGLEVTAFSQVGGVLRIQTTERWRYRHRTVDSGDPVGDASEDSYELVYILKYDNTTWKVDQVDVLSTPDGVRKVPPWVADAQGGPRVVTASPGAFPAKPTPSMTPEGVPTRTAVTGTGSVTPASAPNPAVITPAADTQAHGRAPASH